MNGLSVLPVMITKDSAKIPVRNIIKNLILLKTGEKSHYINILPIGFIIE